jgi:hypothetical protein
MTLYAVTIFLSAFLLFQVQPLIAKIILPWFGGSAAVWSAAMLFFQLVLLAGYTYAHVLIRVKKPKTQISVHAGLLAVSCLLLPILPSPSWKPTQVGDPTLRILLVLLATIGLPYFLLSATSPLLQAWYVRRSGSGMPYRLFALSNFGSMLALLSFPFVVEPRLTSRQQAFTWSGVYVAFAALCAIAAWVSRNEVPVTKFDAEDSAEPAIEAVPGERPRFLELLLWVGLAACASTLLVAVTNHMSQNLAPIPLLWVVPLALYLATFILAFESDRIYNRWIFVPWLVPALGGMAYYIWTNSGNLHIKWLIPGYALGLFICCMMCHGELARRKPAPRYLTLFYLMVSLGGAMGGLFVALIAPHVFRTHLELPIGLCFCALLVVIVLWNTATANWLVWPSRALLILAMCALAGYLARQERAENQGYRLIVRNFYGVLRVEDSRDDQNYRERSLTNGTINHGSQLLEPGLEYQPTSYYGLSSGVGRALRALQRQGPIRVGSIGLGAGVLTSYCRAGDYFRVYEINPLDERIAQTEFTFYAHCPADKQILMGDARLTLERQESQQFDLLSVDAFSSDAIPVHLLTQEALALYFRHLKPRGILALHVSNRYLDLVPVAARGAVTFGKQAMVVSDDTSEDSYLSSTTWVLLTDYSLWFENPSFSGADIGPAKAPVRFRAWTDDYSNIFQILKLD